jgi:hypothetical protein
MQLLPLKIIQRNTAGFSILQNKHIHKHVQTVIYELLYKQKNLVLAMTSLSYIFRSHRTASTRPYHDLSGEHVLAVLRTTYAAGYTYQLPQMKMYCPLLSSDVQSRPSWAGTTPYIFDITVVDLQSEVKKIYALWRRVELYDVTYSYSVTINAKKNKRSKREEKIMARYKRKWLMAWNREDEVFALGNATVETYSWAGFQGLTDIWELREATRTHFNNFVQLLQVDVIIFT